MGSRYVRQANVIRIYWEIAIVFLPRPLLKLRLKHCGRVAKDQSTAQPDSRAHRESRLNYRRENRQGRRGRPVVACDFWLRPLRPMESDHT